jgi:16S rRNA (uracil1498-N3)-methyltransferase
VNRILLEPREIGADGVATFGGARAEHVRTVLHGEVGQILKTGELNGLLGTGEILAISPDSVSVRVCHDAPPLAPWVDLVLAPPRPRILKRLLPQLATLGVGRLVLVGAQKVEKDFWGATLLKEENYRPLLVDGLMQGCVSTIVPVLETRRNFRRFVTDELDAMFPTTRRLVAHPYESEKGGMSAEGGMGAENERLLLAIGPEGGWTDDEVALLESHGFARYSLGPRILRTDTATVALLARLSHD